MSNSVTPSLERALKTHLESMITPRNEAFEVVQAARAEIERKKDLLQKGLNDFDAARKGLTALEKALAAVEADIAKTKELLSTITRKTCVDHDA